MSGGALCTADADGRGATGSCTGVFGRQFRDPLSDVPLEISRRRIENAIVSANEGGPRGHAGVERGTRRKPPRGGRARATMHLPLAPIFVSHPPPTHPPTPSLTTPFLTKPNPPAPDSIVASSTDCAAINSTSPVALPRSRSHAGLTNGLRVFVSRGWVFCAGNLSPGTKARRDGTAKEAGGNNALFRSGLCLSRALSASVERRAGVGTVLFCTSINFRQFRGYFVGYKIVLLILLNRILIK